MHLPGVRMETNDRKSGGVAERVREHAAAQLATQKDRATEGLGVVAQVVRQTTEHLRSQQQETAVRYVEQAADQIERFSQRLKDKDVAELLSDAQQLARRKPILFVGGAFAERRATARMTCWRGRGRTRFRP